MSTLEVIVIIEISCDTMPNYNLEIVAVLYAIPLVVLMFLLALSHPV